MAKKENKVAKNVSGAYYVDSECIACGMCHEIAPDYFKLDDEGSSAYVTKQPDTEDGKTACAEAMKSCPVEAIGDDGE